jgi:hypothetical protein
MAVGHADNKDLGGLEGPGGLEHDVKPSRRNASTANFALQQIKTVSY